MPQNPFKLSYIISFHKKSTTSLDKCALTAFPRIAILSELVNIKIKALNRL